MDLDGHFRVQSLVARPPVFVHPNDTLQHVAQLDGRRVHRRPLVRGPHGMIGLISERDIVRAIADGVNVRVTPVSEVMTTELVTASPTDEVHEAVHRMLDAEVRHLPVLENGVACGMISARDALARPRRRTGVGAGSIVPQRRPKCVPGET